MNILKIILVSFSFAILFHSTNAQEVVKDVPQPPKILLIKPDAPEQGLIWKNDDWIWDQKEKKYSWVRGAWIKEKKDHIWKQGKWLEVQGGYKWVPGSWIKK